MTEQGHWEKARKQEEGWDIALAMNIRVFYISTQNGDNEQDENSGAVRDMEEDSAPDSGMAMVIIIMEGQLMFQKKQ